MNKRILCVLLSGTASFQKIDNFDDAFDEDLKEIARLLEEEYGITCLQAEKPDPTMLLQELQKKDLEAKALVFKGKPTFPIPDEIFLKDKKKSAFPPPKMGKLNSKPKGRKR